MLSYAYNLINVHSVERRILLSAGGLEFLASAHREEKSLFCPMLMPSLFLKAKHSIYINSEISVAQ